MIPVIIGLGVAGFLIKHFTTPKPSPPKGTSLTTKRVYHPVPGDLAVLVTKRFGVGSSDIAAMNGIPNLTSYSNAIKAGTLLLLPPNAVDSGPIQFASGTVSLS